MKNYIFCIMSDEYFWNTWNKQPNEKEIEGYQAFRFRAESAFAAWTQGRARAFTVGWAAKETTSALFEAAGAVFLGCSQPPESQWDPFKETMTGLVLRPEALIQAESDEEERSFLRLADLGILETLWAEGRQYWRFSTEAVRQLFVWGVLTLSEETK